MENTSRFICPVCREYLTRNEKSYTCPKGHLYDISRKGYVNLLMSQQSSLSRHGDSKEMVASRTGFLSLGYYDRLCNIVADKVSEHSSEGVSVLDVGCGECFYTDAVYSRISEMNPDIYGIDISKEALIAGSRRNRNLNLAVASAFDIPVGDGSFDIIINLFAPHSESEFSRILKEHGILIRVFPAENHLFELKKAVYDNPYANETAETDLPGFSVLDDSTISYKINLKSNEEIMNLFSMTPYSYKTSSNDEDKLKRLDSITVTAEFKIVTYEKS